MMNNADMRGIFSALLVSYNEDGSINVPKVLWPYMGGKKVIK